MVILVQAPFRGVPYAESSPVVPHQNTNSMAMPYIAAMALAELAQDIPGYKKGRGWESNPPLAGPPVALN